MSTSIDELGEMFPQFSRDTIQDILAQAGDSAVDCLLELCSSSDQENCGLLVTPWSDESDDSGASWGGVANSGGSPVSNQASGESFPASRGWWVCWKGDRGGSSTGSGYCDKEWECAGVGSPPERGLSLWEGEVEEEVRVVVKEASPGWESVAEGTLNVNDWGMVPVVPVEDRPDSECSSVSLYGTTDPERQKLRFLTTMFAEYSLDVAMVEEVLDAVEGDLDAAVDELLEVTRENDGLSVSLESGGEVEVKGSGVRGEEVLLRLQTWSIHHGRNGTMHIQSPRAKKESSPESSDGDGDKEGDWKMVEATPALRRKAKGLCKRFGDVPKEEIVLDLLQGLHGNVETAARLLREAGLKEIKCTEKIKVPIAPSSGLNAKAAGTSSSLHGNGVDLQCMRVMPRSVNEMSQNEFQSLYYEQRGRALELGELKDQSYKRATEAYQRGDKSLAKTLSLQVCVQYWVPVRPMLN